MSDENGPYRPHDLAPELDDLSLAYTQLQAELRAAQQRERIATATYDGQQQSYRELEALYQASQERALAAESELAHKDMTVVAALQGRDQALRGERVERDKRRAVERAVRAWVDTGHHFRWDKGCETCKALFEIANGTHADPLLNELTLLRELADDLTRWREAGGDIRDLTYVFETMEKYATMKAGGGE